MANRDISESEKHALREKGSLWEEFGRDYDSSRRLKDNTDMYKNSNDGQYKDPPTKAGKAPR